MSLERGLRPFFSYFGSKWRLSKKYSVPRYELVIEPFAGGAGYALRHYTRKVVLVEKDPIIAALWRWLIAAPAADILAIPDVADDQTVDNLSVCQEAKWLVGFWLSRCAAAPRKRPCSWMRDHTHPSSFWGETVRTRIAAQVEWIRHWEVIEGDYSAAPDVEATWFIDPPYAEMGKHYRYGSKGLDYGTLGAWCMERKGQVLVCESEGAKWLPFEPFTVVRGNARNPQGTTREALYEAS